MSYQPTGDVVDILTYIPREMRGSTYAEILRRHFTDHPVFWLAPATNEQVAEVLGLSAPALTTLRHRGRDPKGWQTVEGVGMRYIHGRLGALLWARKRAGFDDLDDIARAAGIDVDAVMCSGQEDMEVAA